MEESEIEDWYEEAKENLHKKFDTEMRRIRDPVDKSKLKMKLNEFVSEKEFLLKMDNTHKEYDFLNHKKMKDDEERKRRKEFFRKVFSIVFFPFKVIGIVLKFLFECSKIGFLNLSVFYWEHVWTHFRRFFFHRLEKSKVGGRMKSARDPGKGRHVMNVVFFWPMRIFWRGLLKIINDHVSMMIKNGSETIKTFIERMKKTFSFLIGLLKNVFGFIGKVLKSVIDFIKKFIVEPIAWIIEKINAMIGKGGENDGL